MLRLIAAGLVTLMTLAMIGGVATFAVIQHFSRDLPTLEKLKNYEPPTATRLYAGNGRLLVEYATEKRIYVPLEAIPKRVIQAFIAAEDKNFYTHPGVDFFGIARAILKNIRNIGTGARPEGASTITQQVVKNFLLTSEVSIDRKVKEALLAFRISKVLPKDTVLELYLNDIYLGYGSYGVASAALNYFNKSMDELTLEEAAYLAALPKGPANYQPSRHYDAAVERRNWVIGRMLADGYITPEEAASAQARPLTPNDRDDTEFATAAFFAEEVRRTLVAMYGSDVLYEGGLTVHTTVDPGMQKTARDALRKALVEYDRRHGFRGPVRRVDADNWLEELKSWASNASLPLTAGQEVAAVIRQSDDAVRIGFRNGLDATIPLEQMKWARTTVNRTQDVLEVGDVVVVSPVEGSTDEWKLEQIPAVNGAMMVMDPHTGRVLAMVGGYSHENTEFNRATQALRQPGSAFKPFVYLAALEAGFTPSTLIMDAPISINQGKDLPMWEPKNYGGDFLGPATMRKGLETSRNVMTVRLALQIGIERIISVGERLGIYENLKPLFSIVLGAQETTLDRLVNAYSMLVNGGKQVQPAIIERIQNRYGQTIYRRDNRECTGCREETGRLVRATEPPIPADNRAQVVDPRIAYQLVSMMEGVVQRGTALRARSLNRPLAGKTGTTNDSRDAWFIGYTPDLVAGVYVGFDNPKKLGNKETGGRVALPAFIAFMEEALKDTPSTPFRIPSGIRLVKLDAKTGQRPSAETASSDIILEAFLPDQTPGAMPVLDVSTPVFEEPIWVDETEEEAEMLIDETGEPVYNTGPPATYQPLQTRPQQESQPDREVFGTGGLY